MLEFFKAADVNHDGMIDSKELKRILRKMNMNFDVDSFFKTIDVNND